MRGIEGGEGAGMTMAGHVRILTLVAATLLLGACDSSQTTPTNAVSAVDPESSGEVLRDQLLGAAEPCVTRVDALLADVTAQSLTGASLQTAARAAATECDQARDAVQAVGAPDAATNECRAYVADNKIIADLAANADRVPSRNSRLRLQDALGRRDRSLETCTTAALNAAGAP